MAIPRIIDLVGGEKTVTFCYYEDGNLWYTTQIGFMFPVPIADAEGARFFQTDKALLFMRWIRKHLEFLKESITE